jgi:hypothetical protein
MKSYNDWSLKKKCDIYIEREREREREREILVCKKFQTNHI